MDDIFNDYDQDCDFGMDEGADSYYDEFPDDGDGDVDELQENNDFAHDADMFQWEDEHLDGSYED